MNRFFPRPHLIAEYRLPQHVQDQLLASIKPVEKDDLGEPLFLEAQVDAWLSERYAGDLPKQPQEEFMTTREVTRLLRCSYTVARDRLLDGRIRAIKDGRWLRTRRTWVEEYVAEKTGKPVERGVSPMPLPKARRHVNGGVRLKRGGIGEGFFQERAKQERGRSTMTYWRPGGRDESGEARKACREAGNLPGSGAGRPIVPRRREEAIVWLWTHWRNLWSLIHPGR